MTKENIGIPVNPPEKECQDDVCVWHGKLPVRGRTFRGIVISSKARNTVVIEWGYTHLVPKYERYERRKSRVVAHNPACMKARDGDEVIIAECRPLSKTKHFVVVAVTKRKIEKAEFRVAEIEAALDAGKAKPDADKVRDTSKKARQETSQEIG